jgi:hypothetical protein
VDSSLKPRTQREFSSLLCLLAHFLDALLAEYLLLFHRTLNSSVSFTCAPMHSLDALLAELSESSVILPLLNSQLSSFLCALLALAQCPPGRAFIESLVIMPSVFKLSAEFFLQHLVLTLNAHSAELYRTYSEVLSATVFPPTQPCLLRCSATSKVFPLLSC